MTTEETLKQAKADCAAAIENCEKLTQPKHTPLPWSAFDNPVGCGVQNNQADIAHCHGFYEPNRTREEEKANAAFIVRACNSHYTMLETLKALKETQLTGDFYDRGKRIFQMMNVIDAAIAKAEGGAA